MKNTKTIALFGGTGFVGSHMKTLLLENGFIVRMLIRTTSVIDQNQNLVCIKGDLSSREAVADVLAGCDACIVMTGPRSGSIEDMQRVVDGTAMIIETMKELGIKRLLKLSGVSVRIKDEPFPLPRRILEIILGLAMKNQSKSKYLEQDMIEVSGLDWTVIRPPAIKPGRASKPLNVHDYAFLGLFVKVENLCNFFMQQIESDQWVQKSPTVG